MARRLAPPTLTPLILVLSGALEACLTNGPPAATDAPPPAECQAIIDACRAAATAGSTAASDCVRIASDGATTAARCVELQNICAAACASPGTDASQQ